MLSLSKHERVRPLRAALRPAQSDTLFYFPLLFPFFAKVRCHAEPVEARAGKGLSTIFFKTIPAGPYRLYQYHPGW